jgi:hypothetical protein
MDNRLRATAAPFTPHEVQNSPRPSNASTYSETLSDGTANLSLCSTDSQLDTTSVNDCALCASIGYRLMCCQPPNTPPCPRCAEVTRLFAKDDQKHAEEVSALRGKVERLNQEHADEVSALRDSVEREDKKHADKVEALRDEVQRLNTESSEERYERLCEEKSTKIKDLKGQVAQVNKEDEALKIDIQEQEKVLKTLEAAIKKAGPRDAFSIKEGKSGKA